MSLRAGWLTGTALVLSACAIFGQQTAAPRAAFPTPGCSATPAQLEANKKVALAFFTQQGDDRVALADPSYIQHNPAFKKRAETNKVTDFEEFKNSFSSAALAARGRRGGPSPAPGPQPPPGNQFEVVTAECDVVTVVHKQYRPDPTPGSEGKFYEAYTFDTFRIRENKLVEHWDQAVINPPPPPMVAVGDVDGGNVVRVVHNFDKTKTFYSSVLGLQVTDRSQGGYPWDTKPWKAPARQATVTIPGAKWSIELVEDVGGKTAAQPRVQDAGAITLILFVRDLNAELAKATLAGAPVVTTGGAPIYVGANGAFRAAVVQDPDGTFVEMLEGGAGAFGPPVGAAANGSDVLRANLRLTVEDSEQAMRVYRDLFGLQFRGGPNNDPSVADMLGIQKGGQLKLYNTLMPKSDLTFELLEVQGVDRKPMRSSIQEAGASYLYLGTKTFDSLVERFKLIGNGKIVAGPSNKTKRATLEHMNNMFLILSDGAPLRP